MGSEPLWGRRHREQRVALGWLEDRPLKPEPALSPTISTIQGRSREGKQARSSQDRVSKSEREGTPQERECRCNGEGNEQHRAGASYV